MVEAGVNEGPLRRLHCVDMLGCEGLVTCKEARIFEAVETWPGVEVIRGRNLGDEKAIQWQPLRNIL